MAMGGRKGLRRRQSLRDPTLDLPSWETRVARDDVCRVKLFDGPGVRRQELHSRVGASGCPVHLGRSQGEPDHTGMEGLAVTAQMW